MARVGRDNMARPRRVPRFESAAEEARFWETHSPLDYPEHFSDEDIEVARPVRHMRVVSVRLDDEIIEQLSGLARRKRIGVTTLARMLIAEGLDRARLAEQ